MPASSAPSTSRRMLALLSLLQTRRDWPARVLAERLDVSERTVRRDVERLRELDYAIDATRGPDGGYRLGAGTRLPPLLFDDDQVVALTLALRTAGSLGAGIEEDAARALRTVQQLLPSHLRHRVESLAPVDARGGDTTADAAVLLRIADAVRTSTELRFDYEGPGGAAEDRPARRAEPHHLVLHDGRWYLLAYSPDDADWRTYRVDRIRPRTHTGRGFSPRAVPGGSPGGFVAARFKGARGGADTWPNWGSATVALPIAAVAPYLGEGHAHALSPERCRVTLGSWSWMGLAAGFARFDAELSDVEPAELREAFTALSARAGHAGRAASPGADVGASRPHE